ncbi:hypothetical protein HNP86_001789 [Methanococcus maripaludis]|uniref:Uncharacterized protein n=1 Tax=Methanococcus maripaludis TaxID=39152 RepID=A0A7J9NVD2_METMI|nr:hypothetical protein [Methanococcus maripaludis]MBA2851630.1 hypothetical protein [Methanococcus maripaludis]
MNFVDIEGNVEIVNGTLTVKDGVVSLQFNGKVDESVFKDHEPVHVTTMMPGEPHELNIVKLNAAIRNVADAMCASSELSLTNKIKVLNDSLQVFADVYHKNSDWTEHTAKYYLSYVEINDDIHIDYHEKYRSIGTVYFATRDIAKEAVRVFGNDILVLYRELNKIEKTKR